MSGALSPCSIVDVWSVVALARPCSVWTITESWSAIASDVEPGDSMFALTAASIGAAMFAFAAIAASIGAARSSARSRSTSRSSSDAGAVEQSSPVVVDRRPRRMTMSSLISPWLIAESCVDVAIASPASSLLEHRVLIGGGQRRRVRRERVRADRRVDRDRDVGVGRHRGADRRREVEVEIQVGVEVEQRRALERAEQVA